MSRARKKTGLRQTVYHFEDDTLPSVAGPSSRIESHTIYRQQDDGSYSANLSHVIVPPSPEKRSAPSHSTDPSDLVMPDTENVSNEVIEEGEEWANPKRRRTQGDQPLLLFLPKINNYLDEFLRLEGPGSGPNALLCCSCNTSIGSEEAPALQCRDCLSLSELWCSNCALLAHQWSPLHRLEQWKGLFFERVSLKQLGVRIQLNHPRGEQCINPRPAFNDDFVIIDSDGIHKVGLDFCSCHKTKPPTTQLLRSRLFPATTIDPRTAATFRVLETFQMLSFSSKLSGFEFLKAIKRRTDNTGRTALPLRYAEFMRMVREWRHIRLLKRMGQGQKPRALRCPACPHPGINIPENWRNSPITWIYALFVAIDANFRLRRKHVSSDDVDPGLNHGYAYVVEETAFKGYLRHFDDLIPDDKSSCNNHDAIKSASIRGGPGFAASGMGIAQCSRHDMKLPVAAGDLQKGERYVNMDYFLLSMLACFNITLLVISYDIACQWSKNLLQRCQKYPTNIISSQPDLSITFLVPKFHLAAHVVECQTSYSFNYTPGVGRTDGEAPERGWSQTNNLAYSTREMGPGSRRDTLDDSFGDQNWSKIIGLGALFKKRAKDAIKARQEHVQAFKEFDAAIPSETTAEWKAAVTAWEKDRSKPNPFAPSDEVLTTTTVRLRLAQEEAAAIKSGEMVSLHREITPSRFIQHGLDLEESQERLDVEFKSLGPHSTDLQRAKTQERANSLQRKIDAWVKIQNLYMPHIADRRLSSTEEEDHDDTPPQEISLFLPSEVCSEVPVTRRLITYIKIKRRASRYRKVRERIEVLAAVLDDYSWRHTLLPLKDEDLGGLTQTMDGSEGRKKLSWIWKVNGVGLDADESTRAALRIEWCKTRARAHRWQEECVLLAEEMRRVLTFFEWEAAQWDQRAVACDPKTLPPLDTSCYSHQVLAERDQAEREILYLGKAAHARQQAALRRGLWMSTGSYWLGLPDLLKSMEGGSAYSLVQGADD